MPRNKPEKRPEPSHDEMLNRASEVVQICSDNVISFIRELCMEDRVRAEAVKRVRRCVGRLARNKTGFPFLRGAKIWMEPYIKKVDSGKIMNRTQALPSIFIRMKFGERFVDGKVDLQIPAAP